jgi:hypothetical protein
MPLGRGWAAAHPPAPHTVWRKGHEKCLAHATGNGGFWLPQAGALWYQVTLSTWKAGGARGRMRRSIPLVVFAAVSVSALPRSDAVRPARGPTGESGLVSRGQVRDLCFGGWMMSACPVGREGRKRAFCGALIPQGVRFGASSGAPALCEGLNRGHFFLQFKHCSPWARGRGAGARATYGVGKVRLRLLYHRMRVLSRR